MPRPGRKPRGAPPAAAKATAPAQDQDIDMESESRGRSRATRSSMAGLTANENTALKMAELSRDAALDRLANEDPTTTENDDNDVTSATTSRRGLTMDTPIRAVDASGLDLADDVFGNLDDSFGLDDSLLAGGNHTMDSSTMSLRNIGRQRSISRSRNSTIIGRNEAPIRPSSRSGATPLMSSSFNIGVFRRRKREPSILGTNRKPRYDTTGSVTGSIAGSAAGSVAGSVAGSDVGSDREISPEAESTPLNERRRSRRSLAKDVEVPATQTPPRGSRKRKSGDDLESSARPEKTSRVAQDEDAVGESDSELSSIDSPLSLPRPMQDGPVASSVEEEEDIAPPASSDSEDEGGDIFPDIHALARRQRRRASTPPDQGQLSDVSSPPSLTHSPNYSSNRGKAASRKRAPSPQYTTADLANLLPKRRVRREEPEEAVDTSGLAQDDDELHIDARSTRRRKGASVAAADPKALKPRQIPAATTRASTRSASRAAKTYSRRTSDKENEASADAEEDDEGDEDGPSQFVALPDDTFGESTVQGDKEFVETEELKAAAKKFKEVDKFELFYEEVTEPSSPMQDAR